MGKFAYLFSLLLILGIEQGAPVEVKSITSESSIQADETAETVSNTILLTMNDYVLSATLAKNSSTDYLLEQLSKGDIIIDMSDYGGFEKVGSFPFNLPTNNEQLNASAGDLILYQGNSLVIFYGANSWNYTRLGKINNLSATELNKILGSDNITVTLSLPK